MNHLTKFTKFHWYVITFFWYRYYAAYLNKCAIHNALSYEDLYCHFVSNLQGKQGLIRNSAKFKTQQFSSASAFCIVLVHHCLRRCQELYCLFILFIYFRLVGYIATCTVPTTTTTQCKVQCALICIWAHQLGYLLRKNTIGACCRWWSPWIQVKYLC